jgi:splicing factor 45
VIAEGKVDIALIQEPWVYKWQVRGLTNVSGTLYTVAQGKNSRSSIYIRNNINALPLLEFCSRDATTLRITYTYGGGNRELVVSSAHLPYDSDEPPPSKEVKNIIDYCHSRKKQLNIGCDANEHHQLWGSTGVNPRGESLMEYLVSSNLNILNHGNEPTFVVSNRK